MQHLAPAGKSSPSLRQTLVRWLLLPLLAIAPLGVSLQYSLALRPATEAFDQALADTVIALSNFVQAGEAGDIRFEMSAQTERSLRTDQFDTVYYAVLAPDSRLVAGDAALVSPALQLPAGGWQFLDSQVAEQPVRLGIHGVACGVAVCQVRVAETRTKRDRVQTRTLLVTGLTVGVLALSMALIIIWAAGRALAPLQRLSQQLAARSLDDLAPLQTDKAPQEVQAVVVALNHLFGRLRSSAVAQQNFLADAAHQLRTPLAVLKTEVELALAEPHPPEASAMLVRLDMAASRAARLASQLLALARADAGAQTALPTELLDLAHLARQAADEWVPRAMAAGIDLGFELQSAPLHGRAWLLQEAISNLLHNALEYAGPGASVTLRTGHTGHADTGHADNSGQSTATVWLEVQDDGPGISAVDCETVFERFRRGRGAGGSGSGLGLTIVRDIVQTQGGQVSLQAASDRPDRPGLRVRLHWPAGHDSLLSASAQVGDGLTAHTAAYRPTKPSS